MTLTYWTMTIVEYAVRDYVRGSDDQHLGKKVDITVREG